MSWPNKNSASKNSLFYNCIEQAAKFYNQNYLDISSKLTISEKKLPLHIRQQILDYFLRERIEINCDLICDLLDNGGVTSFDFWSFCNINSFTKNEVEKILKKLTDNCKNLISLSIGGQDWIYNLKIINGPLLNFFINGDLKKLKFLELQQTSDELFLYKTLENCENLVSLKIKEPSITDVDLINILKKLSCLKKENQFLKLQHLTLPSSIKNQGLLECFKLLKNINSLGCSNFEPILDFLEEYENSSQNDIEYNTFKVLEKTLLNINKLSITNSMGKNAVEQIVKYCPNIVELNLEVQEIMQLNSICKLKHLKSLSLHNSLNLPTSYLTEVLPILENIGHQFISLSLEQFDVLDLAEINKLCPKLSYFSAQWFTILSIGRSSFRVFGDPINVITMAAAQALHQGPKLTKIKSNNEFSNLRLLRLRPRVNRNLSSLAIEYLIKNAKQLEYLELYCCNQFDDALFNHWFELNEGFKKLKYLIIRHCNELNETTVTKLLKTSENLMYLELDKPVLSKTELISNSEEEDLL